MSASVITSAAQAPSVTLSGLELVITSFVQPLMLSSTRVGGDIVARSYAPELVVTVRPDQNAIALIVSPAHPLTSDEAFAAGTYGGESGFTGIENLYNGGMVDLGQALNEFGN